MKRAFLLISNSIEKCSRADVFAIAFFAFLAGKALEGHRGLADFESSMCQGFRYFIG